MARFGGLYGMLDAILVLEDNALLMGSLPLFGALASEVYVTRGLDWYRVAGQAAPRRDASAGDEGTGT